jgi:hypothetical protein
MSELLTGPEMAALKVDLILDTWRALIVDPDPRPLLRL